MNPCFKAALDLLPLGLSPIPCIIPPSKEHPGKFDKRPLVKWGEYQHRQPTEEEICEWWPRWPDAQVGIVTGPDSGIFTLDLDVGWDKEKIKALGLPQDTLIDSTPSGGWHVFFKYPADSKVKTCADLFGENSHVDVRGEGGFTVVAPSQYQDGRQYRWIRGPGEATLKDAPDSLLKLVAEGHKSNPFQRVDFMPVASGVSQGGRNQAAAQMIGVMVRYMPDRYWKSVVWECIRGWNMMNNPPLLESELWTTYMSISNKQMVDDFNKEFPQTYDQSSEAIVCESAGAVGGDGAGVPEQPGESSGADGGEQQVCRHCHQSQ